MPEAGPKSGPGFGGKRPGPENVCGLLGAPQVFCESAEGMPILEPMCATRYCSDMTTARTATDCSLEYQTVAGQKVSSITSGPIESFDLLFIVGAIDMYGALLSQT